MPEYQLIRDFFSHRPKGHTETTDYYLPKIAKQLSHVIKKIQETHIHNSLLHLPDKKLEELAGVLNISPNRVESIIQAARTPLSLEMPTNYEGDLVLGDLIEDEETLALEDIATLILLQEHFDELFKSLPPREVRILKLRYGLLDGQAYTLEEIGRKMGVTRERVRQLEAQGLRRLRTPAIRRKLGGYLGAE